MDKEYISSTNGFEANVIFADFNLMLQGDHGARLGVDHGAQESRQTPGEIPRQIRIGFNHCP